MADSRLSGGIKRSVTCARKAKESQEFRELCVIRLSLMSKMIAGPIRVHTAAEYSIVRRGDFKPRRQSVDCGGFMKCNRGAGFKMSCSVKGTKISFIVM